MVKDECLSDICTKGRNLRNPINGLNQHGKKDKIFTSIDHLKYYVTLACAMSSPLYERHARTKPAKKSTKTKKPAKKSEEQKYFNSYRLTQIAKLIRFDAFKKDGVKAKFQYCIKLDKVITFKENGNQISYSLTKQGITQLKEELDELEKIWDESFKTGKGYLTKERDDADILKRLSVISHK
jgi:hypothetical protein